MGFFKWVVEMEDEKNECFPSCWLEAWNGSHVPRSRKTGAEVLFCHIFVARIKHFEMGFFRLPADEVSRQESKVAQPLVGAGE